MSASKCRKMLWTCMLFAWFGPGLAGAQSAEDSTDSQRLAGDTSDRSKRSDELFELSWYTVDGGGAASAGDGWEVAGTIGQPDAGGSLIDATAVRSGFWSVLFLNEVFSDGFESGDTSAWSQTISPEGGV